MTERELALQNRSGGGMGINSKRGRCNAGPLLEGSEGKVRGSGRGNIGQDCRPPPAALGTRLGGLHYCAKCTCKCMPTTP